MKKRSIFHVFVVLHFFLLFFYEKRHEDAQLQNVLFKRAQEIKADLISTSFFIQLLYFHFANDGKTGVTFMF